MDVNADDSRDLVKAKSDLRRANSELEQLRIDLDRLSLVCRAMYSLLQESAGLSDQDLLRRVDEIDAQDGSLNGRVRAAVRPCPGCGRACSPKQRFCLYCQHPLERLSAFD
ncbi:MAG: zinc ribbon domain-containing protein [Rhodanobacteraceae bacterium]|nr:zinc ribbon domain-containing protein [Rhodanobacteraceae bacterium]